MTKVVAENTEPVYATRCSLGYTFASFFASPLAGVTAAFLVWQDVFFISSIALVTMAVICFLLFLLLEKKGIVSYHQYDTKKKQVGNIKLLLQNRIVKFTLISMLTGIVRTTVVFWLPTYISQHLGFSAETAAILFTTSTFVTSFTSFITIFIYEKLRRDMDLMILINFTAASMFFLLVCFVKIPALNLMFMILAIMSSGGAATMLWSRYCPSLRDTGMVFGVTGFLDFASYVAASASSTLFANAVSAIGWGNLILVWFGLMMTGVLISLPYHKFIRQQS